MKTLYITLFSLVILVSRAHADDVDVNAFEYLDVVETSDGSIWKGVLVEQTPGVQYKIATSDGSLHVIKAPDVVKLSKQKNANWHPAVATPTPTPTPVPVDKGVNTRFEQQDGGGGMAPPYAHTGLRLEPELTSVMPQGILAKAMVGTSSGVGIHAGYEFLLGNFGLGGGGMARVTWWDLAGDTKDMAWTLETQVYGRAAFHMRRVALYTGGSLGVDTNYTWSHMLHKANTTASFGMNLEAGCAIGITRHVAIDFGLDYHPATDSINDMLPVKQSIEYWLAHLGVAVRI